MIINTFVQVYIYNNVFREYYTYLYIYICNSQLLTSIQLPKLFDSRISVEHQKIQRKKPKNPNQLFPPRNSKQIRNVDPYHHTGTNKKSNTGKSSLCLKSRQTFRKTKKKKKTFRATRHSAEFRGAITTCAYTGNIIHPPFSSSPCSLSIQTAESKPRIKYLLGTELFGSNGNLRRRVSRAGNCRARVCCTEK